MVSSAILAASSVLEHDVLSGVLKTITPGVYHASREYTGEAKKLL